MFYILFCLLLSSLLTKSYCQDSKNAVISNYEYNRGLSNNYHFSYDTSDGISRSEVGKDDTDKNLAVDGTVSWVAQDGSRYQMMFKADKNGYRTVIKRISGP